MPDDFRSSVVSSLSIPRESLSEDEARALLAAGCPVDASGCIDLPLFQATATERDGRFRYLETTPSFADALAWARPWADTVHVGTAWWGGPLTAGDGPPEAFAPARLPDVAMRPEEWTAAVEIRFPANAEREWGLLLDALDHGRSTPAFEGFVLDRAKRSYRGTSTVAAPARVVAKHMVEQRCHAALGVLVGSYHPFPRLAVRAER